MTENVKKATSENLSTVALPESLCAAASALHVFRGEVDWVVAASAEDAVAVWLEHYREDPSGYSEATPDGWKLLADERPLPIHQDENPRGRTVTKTCGEWARENGRGLLCSTEW